MIRGLAALAAGVTAAVAAAGAAVSLRRRKRAARRAERRDAKRARGASRSGAVAGSPSTTSASATPATASKASGSSPKAATAAKPTAKATPTKAAPAADPASTQADSSLRAIKGIGGVAEERLRTGRTIELVSCGVPAERHEVAIVDPQAGTRLPDGVVGEIWISGPSVTQGYWGRPEATRDSFGVRLPGEEAMYLRTGDLGLLSDGELFVTGRLKDLIIVRGRNVVPADLEFACAELFGTPADCLQAAFEQDGQSVVVVVEVDTSSLDRARAALPEVREQIARRFSLQALQIVLTRRGTLPRTTSGKVRRGEARTLVSRGDLATIAVAGSGPVSRAAGQVPIPA